MMKRILTMSLLAASVVACDPYGSYSFKSGAPAIKTVSLLSYGYGLGFTGAASGSAWTMDVGCAAVCAQIGSGNDPVDFYDPTVDTVAPMSWVVLFVTFDRQVDGANVQKAVDDCSPAGDWLTVSGTGSALGAGDGYYSCYSPASPADYEGGSVVLFANTGTPGTDAVSGWSGSISLPDPVTAPDINFAGTVAGTAIDVTLHREDLTACGACP